MLRYMLGGGKKKIVYRVLVRAHHAQVFVGVRAQDLFIIGNLNNII